MNIKELAKVAGVSPETVRRTAKSLFPKNFKKGVKTTFSKEQCFDIMKNTRAKNQIDMGELVTQDTQKVVDVVEQEKVDYRAIGEMIGAAVSAAMNPVVQELKELRTTKALPEPIKEDHYSLVAYCAIKGMKINRSELALHGRELKKISIREGVQLKKIPDERWGFVNSYPVDILDEYFTV